MMRSLMKEAKGKSSAVSVCAIIRKFTETALEITTFAHDSLLAVLCPFNKKRKGFPF